MVLFNDVGKLTEDLLTPCRYLTIKNIVSLGNASRADKRHLNSFYEKMYKTKKYSNRLEERSITLNASHFLVFSFSRENVFFEVYVSYPHIYSLKDKFTKMSNALKTVDNIFVEQDGELYLNHEYQELIGNADDLVGGRSIMFYPEVITKDEVECAGIVMHIGEQDNVVEMDIPTFHSLTGFLNEFNLRQSSQSLMNIMAMYEIEKNGITTSGGSQQTNTSSNTTTSNSNINRQVGRKISNSKLFSGSKTFKDDKEEENNTPPPIEDENVENDSTINENEGKLTDFSIDETAEVPFDVDEETTTKVSVTDEGNGDNPTTEEKSPMISMNDIFKEAGNMESSINSLFGKNE